MLAQQEVCGGSSHEDALTTDIFMQKERKQARVRAEEELSRTLRFGFFVSAAKSWRDKSSCIACREVESALNPESVERLQRCIDKALEVLTRPVTQSHSTFFVINFSVLVYKLFTETFGIFGSASFVINEQPVTPSGWRFGHTTRCGERARAD